MAGTTAAVVGAAAAAKSASDKGKAEGKAAERAGEAQAAASEAGIEEQRRQFDEIRKLLAPFVTAGTGSLGQQEAILGLKGQQAQQAAIAGFEQSPIFQAMTRQQENSILQNAAATGGLRGGNVQAALSQFRPQLLDQLIQRQFSNLGGLTQTGLSAAGGQATAGQSSAANISNLLAQQGQAVAGGILGKAEAKGQARSDIAKIGGSLFGLF